MNVPSRRRPVTDVLVKPAGPDCNLACAYCFYTNKERLFPGPQQRMSEAVLEALIAQLMALPAEHLSIGWQGGEPTLMGVPFYRKALGWMQQYGRGQSVSNGLQTNGLLIDRQWARLFRDYHFLIGISLDGPEHIHDHYRRSRGGGGSFRKGLAGARRLLDSGVEVNVLTVVNDHSAKFPDEIYAFHREQGLNFMQFIPCVESDPREPGALAPYSVSAEAYGAFLCRLFDRWLADFRDGAPTTSIRFFESLLFRYAGFSPTECTLLEECGTYVVVEHNGDVYACDFSVEPEWKLGNLREVPLGTLMNSTRQAEFGRRKARLHADCLACEWKSLCRGGCPKDRRGHADRVNRNHLCEGFRMFFSHADASLRALVADWQLAQGRGLAGAKA